MILFFICYNVQTRQIPLTKNSLKRSFDVCDQYLNATNCYYFACIDSIYQCGEGNSLVQFSYPFCKFLYFDILIRKMFSSGVALLERTYNSLTRSGQVWSQVSQTCLMQELNYFLKSNRFLTCTQMDQYVLEKSPICLTQSHPFYSFCSIICNNLEIFLEIFDNWNIKSLNLRRFFLEISHLCEEQSQMEYVIDLPLSNIRTILWSLCLDSFKTQFKNFHPNQILIKINQRLAMFAEINEED
jgi:hypothetical protein